MPERATRGRFWLPSLYIRAQPYPNSIFMPLAFPISICSKALPRYTAQLKLFSVSPAINCTPAIYIWCLTGPGPVWVQKPIQGAVVLTPLFSNSE